MATLRKHKIELENSNKLELLSSVNEEENLEFCETINLEIQQKRMLPLSKFMKAIQALNDLFAYYLRSHGYNPDAHIFTIHALQHDPYRIELHHYRKTDLSPLLDFDVAVNTLQPLLSVVKDSDNGNKYGEPSANKKPDGTEKKLFYHFIFQFLEPKLKDILRKAGRKYLSLGSIQLKQLHTFFDLGSVDFYSSTEIVVIESSSGSIFKLNYNGMQANAIVDQCVELIGHHPDLAKTLNYQIISFTSVAKRLSEKSDSICGVIHDISPQPIPIITENDYIKNILKNTYQDDSLGVPYLVADVQLRLIDNRSVGAYIVHRLHARGKQNL